ncbi:MAG: hypothetical protein ABIR96_09155 [Bdellovibrionota bacterium]
MPTKKKPAVKEKKPAGKITKEKAAPEKKSAAPKAVAKAPLAKAKAEPAKKVAAPKAPGKKQKAVPAVAEIKGKKSKASLKELDKPAKKFSEDELDEDMELDEDGAESELLPSRPARKPKPRYDEEVSTELTDGELGLEEGEVSEDVLDTAVELEEDDLDEDTEGPPPWWKDDPTGIEAAGDEAGSRANVDDSDEWSEDDEDWASKRGSFDDVEDAGDEEDSW